MAHTSTLGNGLNSLNKTFPPNHPLNGSKHLCSICGDRSNGKHYGTYSCEACKGFFKRVVRKNLSYICRENKQCLVDKLQRNRCQYCRYQKCLAMGMKIEAVQIENQRVKERERYEDENANISSSFNIYYDERQQTKDRERNEAENAIVSSSFLIDYQQTKGRQNNEVENTSSFQRTMSLQNILEAERTVDLTLESMVEKQRVKEGERNEVENAIVSSSFQIDYNVTQQMKEGERNEVENVSNFQRNMSVQNILEAERRVDFHLGSIVEYENDNVLFQATDQQLVQLVEWAKKIPHFLSLPLEDQVLLLKTGWNELLIARFSHSSIEVKEEIIVGPRASISRDTANQAGIDTIFDRVLNEIVSKMRELKMDKAELGFLRTIILYNPVVQGLKSVKEIEALRDDVYESLEEYTRINHPNDPMRFAKLLIRLPSLRSLGLKCPQPLFFFRVLYDKPIDTCLLHMLQSSGLPNRIQSWNEPTDAVEDIIDDFFPVHLSIFL